MQYGSRMDTNVRIPEIVFLTRGASLLDELDVPMQDYSSDRQKAIIVRRRKTHLQ